MWLTASHYIPVHCRCETERFENKNGVSSLTRVVYYCTSFIAILDQTSLAEPFKQLPRLTCDMASGSAGQSIHLSCSTTEIIVIDDDEIDQPPSRTAIYGEGVEPLPEADPSPNDGPLWQWRDVDTGYGHWLESSVQQNYTKLGWQAERVWAKATDQKIQWNFRAAVGILEWVPTRPPVYAIIAKMRLIDSDKKSKLLMLLVEPDRTRGWETIVIKILRRCIYMESYRSRMVDTEFTVFNDVQKLRRVVRALVTWVLRKPVRLSDIFNGTWQDLQQSLSGSF